MNNSKLSKRLIISCFTTTCLLAFMLLSCETEEVEPQSIKKEQQDPSKKGNSPDRIDICHYDEDTGGWMQITVSERAWEDHSRHGDQWLDQDGDGFTAANECGIGSMDDCDDTDAQLTDDCSSCPFLNEETLALFNFNSYLDARGGSTSRSTGLYESNNSSIEITDHIEGSFAGRTFYAVIKNGVTLESGELDSAEPCRSVLLKIASELGLPCFYQGLCDGI